MENTNFQQEKQHLYKKWLKEFHCLEVIETEHGFMTYAIVKDKCVIYDMYVDPDHRGSRESAKMADMISSIAKENGANKLIGFVPINQPYPEVSLKCQLNYGFKILMIEKDKITLEKELDNGCDKTGR